MLRPTRGKLLMVAALAVACLMLLSGSALAFHGHRAHGGWYGSGYGYGHGCGGGCGGWGYGSGYGWGNGSYSGYGYPSSYCSPCGTGWGWNSGWNSCWGSWNSSFYGSWSSPGYSYYGAASGCCSAAVVARSTVGWQQTPLARTPAPVLAQASKPAASYRPAHDGVLLSMDVPEDARVYVNGTLTKTAGTHRQYACSGLLPGNSYTYQVQAVVTRNGKELSDTQVVRFRAGETRDLAFDLGGHPVAVAATRLR